MKKCSSLAILQKFNEEGVGYILYEEGILYMSEEDKAKGEKIISEMKKAAC